MYRNLNDYELVYMVCENNNDVYNLLYQKYQPLIIKLARNYLNTFKKFGYDMDDLKQIGYLTLYKTMHLYKDSYNSIFYTYFIKALNNAYLTEISINSSSKKKILNEAFSYDIEIYDDITYLDLFSSSPLPDEDYFGKIRLFKNSLTWIDSCIFELYYNGYKREEICELLEIKNQDILSFFKTMKKHSLTFSSLFLN